MRTVVVLIVLLTTSCVKTVRSTSVAAAKPEPPAVTRVMKRQATNAVDAGDGDALVRSLRARMAAEPDNVAIRLELAHIYEAGGYPELAVEHYRLGVDRFPDSAGAAIGLARSLHAMNLDKEALAALERFNTAYPRRSADALAWMGILG